MMAKNTMNTQWMIEQLANEFIGLRTSGRLAFISFNRIEQEMMDTISRRYLWKDSILYMVGSTFEGLSDRQSRDHDIMVRMQIFPLIWWESHKREKKKHCVGYLLAEQNPNQPAYMKLRAVEKCHLQDEDLRDIIDKDGYLNSNDFMNLNLNKMSRYYDDYKIQGPSLMTVIENDVDTVFCLKCQSWPHITSNFFNRERPNNWPSQELLDRVSGLDCLAVAIGHPSTSSKDMEWRLSFSVAEKELIHGMYASFTKCMHALKMLKKNFVYSDSDKPTPFCSYFIKTACLWMCETLPHTSNVMDLIRKTLDWLIDCYQCRNLPHYFIPQQNLIGYLSVVQCDSVRETLIEVKEHLWSKVMSSLVTAAAFRHDINNICDRLNITEVEEDNYTKLEGHLLDNPLTTQVLDSILPQLHFQCKFNECIHMKDASENDFRTLSEAIPNLIDKGVHPLEILDISRSTVMPIIERIDKIVPNGLGGVFKTRLYRYLGDVYTYLLIFLRNKHPHEDLMPYNDKPLELYKLGAEMVFTSQWRDHGVGYLVFVLKHHYLMGNYKELKETLESLEPKLADLKKKLTNFDAVTCIEVRTDVSSKIDVWATDKLLHHHFSLFHQKVFMLHSRALVLYIKARVLLNEGDIENALEIVKEMKCLNIEIHVMETTDILITVIEILIGLLMLMRKIYFSRI